MNYFILIIVALVGVALGMYIARRNANAGFIDKQMEQKAENKQKILAFVQEHGKIHNNDVEKLSEALSVSIDKLLK